MHLTGSLLINCTEVGAIFWDEEAVGMGDNCLGSIALELSVRSKESSSVGNLINRLGIEVVMLQ